MNNWEKQVARILGTPVTDIEKSYYGKHQVNMLQVNEETLLTYYDYLRDELQMPFTAYVQTQPLTCLSLESEQLIDEQIGIRVKCTASANNEWVPITHLSLEANDPNASTILLYQKWLQAYHV